MTSAPTTVAFHLSLDIPSNDLDMLTQLAEREGLTLRALLLSTLQADLAQRAEDLGLSYHRGWRQAYRLCALLQAEIDHLRQLSVERR